MFIYTVYKTTNLVNGKIYVGVHKTKNPNDSYLGSGNQIKRAIEKYGADSFSKEILFEYADKDLAYAKEAEIVNEEFLLRDDVYNLCHGGKAFKGMLGKTHTEEHKQYLRELSTGKLHTQDAKDKMRQNASKHWEGKKFTESHKSKMAKAKQKRVEIDGIEFDSMTAAAKHFNRGGAAIRFWIKKGRGKFILEEVDFPILFHL